MNSAQKKKLAKVFSEFKNKKLKIGKSDKQVTSKKQAIAIALKEARSARPKNGSI